jgi:hypothetical protein
MLDGYIAEPDANAEILDITGTRNSAHAGVLQVRSAGRRNEVPSNHGLSADALAFISALNAGDASDDLDDTESELPIPERISALLLAHRHDDPIEKWAAQPPRPALDLTGTTPTRLPDLLRAVSRQAGHLAGDPFNALDNNPFIVREWLIVSQVLHAAATTLEQRFDALFQGI